MYLIRHGQSAFNLAYERSGRDPGIPDPSLTPLGEDQAQRAADDLARRSIRRIVVSPYTRALQTAAPIATALGVNPGVEVLVRERAYFSCDIGSPASHLSARWPELRFDHLDERWWEPEAESEAALRRRCAAFLAQARSWPDHDEVLVVSHWGFILGLTGHALGNGEVIAFDPVVASL